MVRSAVTHGQQMIISHEKHAPDEAQTIFVNIGRSLTQ